MKSCSLRLSTILKDVFPHYLRNNGDTTINDLLGRPQGTPVNPVEDAEAIKAQYPELIAFLRERPLYIDEEICS